MLQNRVAGRLHRWRVSRYEHRQFLDTLKLERSVLSARMADERLVGIQARQLVGSHGGAATDA
jgi:hypothetical protein